MKLNTLEGVQWFIPRAYLGVHYFSVSRAVWRIRASVVDRGEGISYAERGSWTTTSTTNLDSGNRSSILGPIVKPFANIPDNGGAHFPSGSPIVYWKVSYRDGSHTGERWCCAGV